MGVTTPFGVRLDFGGVYVAECSALVSADAVLVYLTECS